MGNAKEPRSKVIWIILLNYLFFWGAIQLIGPDSDRKESLVLATVFGFISVFGLGLYVRRFIGKGSNAVYLLSAAFLIKMLVGIGHFLWLIQPEYFTTTEDPTFLGDYLWFHKYIKFLAEYRIENGYLAVTPLQVLAKEQFSKSFVLAFFTSDLYLFAGSHFLNISVFNTLFSLYTSVIVGILTLKMTRNRTYAYTAVFLCAFQGFSIISSIMMRDIIGQTFIAASVYGMYSFRRSLVKTVLFLPVATLLFFAQRVTYALIPSVIFFIYFLFSSEFVKQANIRAVMLAIVAPVFLVLLQSFEVLKNFENYSQAPGFENAFGLNYLIYLPLNIPKGLLGPWPWVQFLDFKHNTVLQIADYYQAVFNFALVAFLWSTLIKKYRTKAMDIVTMVGLILLGFGIFSGFMNSTYIGIGLVFLIPCVSHIPLRRWFNYFGIVLVTLLALNVLYMGAGFYGKGVTNFNY